ncbi:MAG: hypothetical protein KIT31_30765 [Deltaproteobacteria bacterium]|nr:hypothetical protein [Deltaproteobacteria bacterium]
MRRALIITIALSSGACVDGFTGSNIEIDFSPGTPAQASPGLAPGPGELPADIHFKLYAITDDNGTKSLFELRRFEIHRIIDLRSPCYIDAGPTAVFPGIHVTQFNARMIEKTGIADVANPPPGASERDQIDAATAAQRQNNVNALAGPRGLKVVTSASPATYPDVDADCSGSGLPPPSCADDASNARRLRICRETWAANPDLYEGTDRVLTQPLNGTNFGFVLGLNPIAPTPVGGAGFFVDQALAGVDEYAIYFQTDGVADPGSIFLTGRPTQATRGVRHVDLQSPPFPNVVSAKMAIFADLGRDDVHF